MSSKMIQQYVSLDEEEQNLLRVAMQRMNLSARAYDRILKVSRTIADLDGSPAVQSSHIAEAINYRNLDREGWAGGLSVSFYGFRGGRRVPSVKSVKFIESVIFEDDFGRCRRSCRQATCLQRRVRKKRGCIIPIHPPL